MAIKGIAPGSTGTFDAGPVNADGVPAALPAGVIPQWSSSDSVNAPVIAAADGLSATVTPPASAPTGVQFTLSVTATLPDGTTPSGSAAVPLLVAEVTAFVISQR